MKTPPVLLHLTRPSVLVNWIITANTVAADPSSVQVGHDTITGAWDILFPPGSFNPLDAQAVELGQLQLHVYGLIQQLSPVVPVAPFLVEINWDGLTNWVGSGGAGRIAFTAPVAPEVTQLLLFITPVFIDSLA